MHAYSKADPTERPTLESMDTAEADVKGWNLSAGVAALGRIWTGLPDERRGPILTTNFDPLVEIGIRRSGGSATPYVQIDDSSFLRNMRVQTGSTSVVHLHGFWREGATQHTPEELELGRPVLAAALRALLQTHTLLIMGYGAWNDVVTRQLLATVREDTQRELDVLWALHESGDALQHALAQSPTMQELRKAPSNVVFYEGIDVETLLPELERRLADVLTYEDRARDESVVHGIVGWSPITQTFIEKRASASSDQSALSFFDGRLPTWSDASDIRIPARSVTTELVNYVSAQMPLKQSSFSLVLGPSGEGKSIAIRQAAVQLKALNPDLSVLALEGDNFGHVDRFHQLDPSRQYLLVVDDAADFERDLERLAAALHEQSPATIHLLGASRDTDWRSVGGSAFTWSRYLSTRTFTLNRLTRADALAIVTSWESLGLTALGELSRLPNTDERVDELLRVAADQHAQNEGSLLGALLVTRYADGLREHIRDLMWRLSQRIVRGLARPSGTDAPAFTLLDALVTTAFLHTNEVPSLTFSLLADCLDLSDLEVQVEVIAPLGLEAAISYSVGKIFVRHRIIASVICDLAEQFDIELEAIARRLVAVAVGQIELDGVNEDRLNVAYLASRIKQHPNLQIPAARAAVEASPNRLQYWTSLSSIVRASDPNEAASINASVARRLNEMSDLKPLPGFYTEWAVSVGEAENWRLNAFLAAASLRDGILSESRGVSRSVSCLVLPLRKLTELAPQSVYARGLRAAVSISLAIDFSELRKDWLHEAERVLARAGYSAHGPDAVVACAADLDEVWRTLRNEVRDELPAALPIGSGFERVMRIFKGDPLAANR
jgi:hypothetical protein